MKKLAAFLLTVIFMLQTALVGVSAATDKATLEKNEKTVYEFLKSELGLNNAEACGVLANIYGESRFVPTASCIDVDGYESYGLCQWHVTRLQALKNFCEEKDLDYETVEGQLQYLKYELTTSEKFAYSMILGLPDNENGAYTAGYNWCRYFGRGASSLYEYRGNLSKSMFWPKYGDPTAEKTYALISNGSYYISNNSNGKCITVPSHAQYNGADVALSNLSENDYFRIVVSDADYGYTLKPRFTYTHVVNIYATLVSDGKNVTLYEPTGHSSQAWYFEAVEEGYIIRSVQKEDLVLDVSSDGSVIVKTYDPSKKSQVWTLTPADVPSAATPRVQCTNDSVPVSIEWDAAENADRYSVMIYNVDLGEVTLSALVSETRFASSLDAGNYSVTVESINDKSGMTAVGDSISFSVEKLHVHDFSGVVETIENATCTKKGSARVYCTGDGCGEFITVETDMLPHDFKILFTPPTATSNGSIARLCRSCLLYEVTEVLNMPDDGDPVISVDSTEVAAGKEAVVLLKMKSFSSVSGGVFKIECGSKSQITGILDTAGTDKFSFDDGYISFERSTSADDVEVLLLIKVDGGASGKITLSVTYDTDSFSSNEGDPVYPALDLKQLLIVPKDGFLGDANRDGDVNTKDVLIIRRYIAGLVDDGAVDLNRADVDGNHSCDSKDVLKIRRFIAGLDDLD